MKKISPALAFFMNFSSIHQRFNKSVDGNLSVHGLSINEFMVLHHLNNARNTTMSRVDLANSVGLTASGITRLLNPLEKIHLVEKQKNARDARVSLVKLSKAGVQMYSDALITCNHSTTTFLQNITTKQRDTLLDLFGKI